jgi:hypothetical protein
MDFPPADKSKLDICIMLINKQEVNATKAIISVRHPLVMIELKVRPGSAFLFSFR